MVDRLDRVNSVLELAEDIHEKHPEKETQLRVLLSIIRLEIKVTLRDKENLPMLDKIIDRTRGRITQLI